MRENISTIIIDDEERSRKGLRSLIGRFCKNVNIIGEADDVNEAYELINELKPELIFLDIQMPNGSGFSLLKRFNKINFEIIFVTGYNHYAINAIKFSALDYLLKPVEVTDLKNAVERALEKKLANTHRPGVQIINLLNNIDESSIDKSISVHQNDRVEIIKVKEIKFIEADSRYSKIHCSNNVSFTMAKTLKEFEEFLENNKCFNRINKNIIINLNYVKDYSKGEPCMISLLDGNVFEVSRRKKQEMLETLKGKIK